MHTHPFLTDSASLWEPHAGVHTVAAMRPKAASRFRRSTPR